MVWIMPLSEYARLHRKHHGLLATNEDPDLQFLKDCGFCPGLPVRKYWKRKGALHDVPI